MTSYILSIIVCIIAVETFIRLPLKTSITSLHLLINKIIRVVTSPKISDHWKEKVLLRYAGNMALQTLKLAFIFLMGAGIIIISALLLDSLIPSNFSTLEFLVTIPGLMTATVASTAYFLLRKSRGN